MVVVVLLALLRVVVVKPKQLKELVQIELVLWAHPCSFCEENQPSSLKTVTGLEVRSEHGNMRHEEYYKHLLCDCFVFVPFVQVARGLCKQKR